MNTNVYYFFSLLQWTGIQGGIGTCCQFSHNGKIIATGTDLDNCLTIWDAQNGAAIQSNKSKTFFTNLVYDSLLDCTRWKEDLLE